MVRARRQYHHHNHHHQHTGSAGGGGAGQTRGGGGGGGGGNRHVLNHNHHSHRSNKRPPAHVPSAPSNTTQFIMNDHELIEPDFNLMHNAIMEHYNRRKRRKSQHEQEQRLKKGNSSDDDLEEQEDDVVIVRGGDDDYDDVVVGRGGGGARSGDEESCTAKKSFAHSERRRKLSVKEITGSQGDDCKKDVSYSGAEAEERQKKIDSYENDSPTKRFASSLASPLRGASNESGLTTTTHSPSYKPTTPLKDVDAEESKNHHHHHHHQQQMQLQKHNHPHQSLHHNQLHLQQSHKQHQLQHHSQQQQQHNQTQPSKQTSAAVAAAAALHTTSTIQATPPMQLQESTNLSQPSTPNYRPVGSPGDEDGLSPFINYEHLQSEFQEVYSNIHTERLSSMSKHQLVDKYLLLEERVEELENQLLLSKTAAAASHG